MSNSQRRYKKGLSLGLLLAISETLGVERELGVRCASPTRAKVCPIKALHLPKLEIEKLQDIGPPPSWMASAASVGGESPSRVWLAPPLSSDGCGGGLECAEGLASPPGLCCAIRAQLAP